MVASAHLALSLSGAFQATLRGAPLEAIESNKGRALLAYLAVEADRPHSRLHLAALLWPEETEAASRQNLRQLLYNLRQALSSSPDAEPFLLVDAQTVQFNPASDHWLDVRAFLGLIETCERHGHRRLDACRDCLGRLQQAASLYRGDFLAGFSLPDSDEFEGWLTARARGAAHTRPGRPHHPGRPPRTSPGVRTGRALPATRHRDRPLARRGSSRPDPHPGLAWANGRRSAPI